MSLTWKKWVCLLIVVILAGTACHFYARAELADVRWSLAATSHLAGVSGPEPWSDRSADGAWKLIYFFPWHLGHLLPPTLLQDLEPQDARTEDAETLMGLALIELIWLPREEPPDQEGPRATRFGQWSKLALASAESPAIRSRLQKVRLYALAVTHNHQLKRQTLQVADGASSTRPAEPIPSLQDRFIRHVCALGQTVDPTNALYPYLRAQRKSWRIVADRAEPLEGKSALPSKALATHYLLRPGVDVMESARELDAILSPAEPGFKMDHFPLHRRQLIEKALLHLWGPQVNRDSIRLQSRLCASLLDLYPPLGTYRDLTMRLCFLGGRLDQDGQDPLALRMSQHANRIAERLLLDEGLHVSLIQALTGIACARLAETHLMEFWSRQGRPETVLPIAESYAGLEQAVTKLREHVRDGLQDPLGEAFPRYVRAAGLTWWLALTGSWLAGLSLIASAAYLIMRRWRSLGSATLSASRRKLVLAVGLPMAVLVWLGLVFPLQIQLDWLLVTIVVVIWAHVLTALWFMAIGLLARSAVSPDVSVRRPGTGWIWPATAAGVFAAGVVAAAVAGDSFMAAVASAAVVLVGLVVWCAAVFDGWSTRRRPADKAYRARAAKAFAVCAMLAAAVALLAALATMPLTRFRQSEYFEAAVADMDLEILTNFGEDWPGDLRPLELESFPPAESQRPPAATAPAARQVAPEP